VSIPLSLFWLKIFSGWHLNKGQQTMAVAKLSLFDPAGLSQLPDQSDRRAYARLLGRRELTVNIRRGAARH
jgi:hypothetical protein